MLKFISLGCKVNSYESAALKELFLKNGFKEDGKPDVVVINTCSVTAVADQKSRQIIRRERRNNKYAVLVVMGCFSQKNGEIAVSLWSPITGIRLDVYTNEPGVQVYTGNFLDGSVTGKYGKVYDKRAAICLETQKYPDTPNKPNWPTALLKPGETYHSHCAYKFSVAEKLTK